MVQDPKGRAVPQQRARDPQTRIAEALEQIAGDLSWFRNLAKREMEKEQGR